MSKLNQIQQKIKELNGGSFQKLADSYLTASGYNGIVSLGSVVGGDGTRKGTPDSYFILPNGKYVFCEYTVQKDRLLKKINEDIDKCFDFSVTNIEIDKIQEIVYCHTSQVYPIDINDLTEKCAKKGVYLRIIGIDLISQDLYQKYPKLAKDFLGVEIDSGQILNINDFIKSYDQNTMATPLGINFHFREDEIKDILMHIEINNSVIVSGKAGIGKSKLVLECCKKYAETHSMTKVSCIKNNGRDIFEDLKTYFSDPGEYLIFIDDANQTTPLNEILSYLNKKDLGINVKIIATVRDYALERVVDKFFIQTKPYVLKVDPLTNQQIRHIAIHEFKIYHPLFLDRIVAIAKGNPRIAVMACNIAVKQNTLDSIQDTTQLLDEYFRNVKKDLEDLENGLTLKVAGLVTFFNYINLKDNENISKICEITKISKEEFFNVLENLHFMEIVDIYEDEIVKVSDQILSTYLFYLVFIDKKTIKYSDLLKEYFPTIKQKVIENINSVLLHFDSQKTDQIIKSEINAVWEYYVKESDTRLTDLMYTFWFVRESETLNYIYKKINEVASEDSEQDTYTISNNDNDNRPDFINTLLQYQAEENFPVALEILLEYLERRPSQFSMIYYRLTRNLGFDKTSYYRDYFIQKTIIKQLVERADGWNNKLFTIMFLRVAKNYLKLIFEQSESNGKTVTIYKVPILSSNALSNLRGEIWSCLLKLIDIPIYQNEVLSVLSEYGLDYYKEVDKGIADIDINYLSVFLDEKLNCDLLEHCKAVNLVVKRLYDNGILSEKVDISRFQGGFYKLYSVLSGKQKHRELDYESQQKLRRAEIASYLADFNLEDYHKFFRACKTIQNNTSREDYLLEEGIGIVFSIVSEDKSLFPFVIDIYLSNNVPLNAHPKAILEKLILTIGLVKTEVLIRKYDYFNKNNWLYYFFVLIPKEKTNQEYLIKLYKYFEEDEGEVTTWMRDLYFLQNFAHIDTKIFINVTKIILEKADNSPITVTRTLNLLFNPYNEISRKLFSFYKEDLEVLKNAYFTLVKLGSSIDCGGFFLKEMIQRDNSFLLEFIEFIISKKNKLSLYNNEIDFTFLWEINNASKLVQSAFNFIIKKSEEKKYLMRDYLKELFNVTKENKEIIKKQDEWIEDYISNNYENATKIKIIFHVITSFNPDRRIKFISLLLTKNKSFEVFRSLSLEPDNWGWIGSEVPLLENRITFYESLLPVLRSVELLDHREDIEYRIRILTEKIKKVKISEYISDF